VLSALKHRNVAVYVTGQTLSTLGDRAMWLAMGIYVKILTGSNAAAGLTVFCYFVGTLLGPLGGTAVDRFRRRPLLIVSNAVIGGLILLLLAVSGRGDVWLIYTVMFFYGAIGTVISAGGNALVGTMVEEELLAEANSALQTGSQGVRADRAAARRGAAVRGGRGRGDLGGCGELLRGHRRAAAARIARGEAGAGPAALLRRGDRGNQASAEDGRAAPAGGRRAADGHRVRLRRVRGLRRGRHRPASQAGVPRLPDDRDGRRALAAASVAARLIRRLGEGLLVGLGMAAFAVGALLLTSGALAVVVVGIVLFGVSLPWINIGLITIIQKRTPPQLLGRAMAGFDFLTSPPQVLAIAGGAAMVADVSYRLMLVIMAALVGVAALYLGTRREQRLAPAQPEEAAVPAQSEAAVPAASLEAP
jgi:MFS family permease